MARILVKKENFKKQLIEIKRKGAKEDTVRVMNQAIQHLRDFLDIQEGRYTGTKEGPFLFVTLYRGTAPLLSRRAIDNLVTKYTAVFSYLFIQGEGMSPHKLSANFIQNVDHIVLLWNQLGQNKIKTTSLYENLSIINNEKLLRKLSQSDR